MNALKRTFGFIHQHPLAKNHLWQAYSRFIIWQIKSYLNPNLQSVRFVGNIQFFAKKNLTGITGNIYVGLHEFNEMGFLLHFLKPNDTFFDVGANVGSYTLLAAGICGSHTVSFEPVVSTCEILRKNIALNKLQHVVRIENKGVGSQSGSLAFSNNKDTTNHVLSANEEVENPIVVPIVTLDQYEQHHPCLIKIDVEGFETEVLNGAQKVLDQSNLMGIIIELNGEGERYGFDETKIHLKLLGLGFKTYNYHPLKRKLEELATFNAFNTIYLRDLPVVESRLATAVHFNLFNRKI